MTIPCWAIVMVMTILLILMICVCYGCTRNSDKTSQEDKIGIKEDERKAGTMNIEMQLQKKNKFPVLGAI